jgi:hypothetical protein
MWTEWLSLENLENIVITKIIRKEEQIHTHQIASYISLKIKLMVSCTCRIVHDVHM